MALVYSCKPRSGEVDWHVDHPVQTQHYFSVERTPLIFHTGPLALYREQVERTPDALHPGAVHPALERLECIGRLLYNQQNCPVPTITWVQLLLGAPPDMSRVALYVHVVVYALCMH
jgi:hypothetical protein